MKEIVWEDINCVVRVDINKDVPTMDFWVFEIVAWGEDSETGEYTVFSYIKKGATNSDDTTENTDEAQTLLRGHIKWDACSHVYFGDEDGYIHICGGESWFNFMEAIKRIWEIAVKELPRKHSADMFDLSMFKPPVK